MRPGNPVALPIAKDRVSADQDILQHHWLGVVAGERGIERGMWNTPMRSGRGGAYWLKANKTTLRLPSEPEMIAGMISMYQLLMAFTMRI